MKYKAFIFDVDGTLVDSKKKIVPASTIQAIHLLQAKGYPIIIASGRPLYCAPIVEKAGIQPDFFVGNNGTVVCDANKKIIFEMNIKKEHYLSIKEYCEKNKISVYWKYRFGVYGHMFDEQGENTTKEFSNYEERDLKDDELPNAISIVCKKEDYLKIKEKYQNEFDMVDGGWLVYDITAKGVSKVDGVKACLDYLKISFNECVAFGDSENDVTVLKEAGLSICMGNGQAAIKKECDYVCDDVDKDGIYKALKEYHIL